MALHEQRSKRARVSDAKDSPSPRQRDGREGSAASNDNASAAGDSDHEGAAPSQYEMMRDMDFVHLLDEDGDDQEATQRLHDRVERFASLAADTSGDNRKAANGIIEKVTCVNFMCHTRLECELGPLLNFIVGENGSGKSAVLTAITLCLGAKASSTNRGGSLKSFVKQGEERGFLAVKIKNGGDDAYEPDIYGESITVERHFSKTGTSSFKLKSATDRVISNKRADVDDIVEYYYLHVDNPLNVLSQDNARQFLNSSSSSQKYKFFIQGVQLEQLDKDYQLIKQYVDSHNDKIPLLEERVVHAAKKLEQAKQVEEVIRDNQRLRSRKRTYLNQLAWAQVTEQEALLEAQKKLVSDIENNIADAMQQKEACGQKLEIENDKVRRAEDALTDLKTGEDDIKRDVEAAEEKHAAALGDLRSLHSDERDIRSRLKGFADRVKELEEKIAAERERLEDTSGDQRREIESRLEAAKARLGEVTGDVDREATRLSGLDGALAIARKAAQDMALEVDRKREDVRAREARVRNLRANRGSSSPYDGFDQRMPDLVRLIERENRFSQKPIGPIGAKIRVLKPVWSPILEKTFGGSLNGFIVTSHADQQVLSGLVKRANMNNIPILIANSRPINTEGREPDPQFDTILRVLEFDDPLIRGQLIINNYIEQVILVEDRKRAEQIMFNGPAPQNVVACLSLHDQKRGEGLRLTSRVGGNVSTAPVIPNYSQKARMKTDIDSQIAVQEDVFAQGQEELNALRARLEELRGEERQRAGDIERNTRRLDVLRKAARAAAVTIGQVESELDVFDGADGRLDAYEQEVVTARQNKDQFGSQYGEVNLRKTDKGKEVDELKALLDEERVKQRDLQAKVDKMMRSLEKHKDLRRVALVEKNDASDTLERQQHDKEEAEQRCVEQAAVVEEFKKQASKVSTERVPIPEGETHTTIEKKVEKLMKQLEQRRNNIGMTDEDAHNRFVRAKELHDKMVQILESSQAHVEALTSALVHRLQKWRIFQRWISASARTNFIYLLSERSYRGKLLLDHKARRLQVQVEPDDTRTTVSGRDTRTLSGGEKSFSSICLLLSIWEAMGSPLRCLDEFDVFMDNVNRAVSTTMLVDAARRQVGRQYIFITPNSIQGEAQYAPDVKIIRLTDPRQRTLDQMA